VEQAEKKGYRKPTRRQLGLRMDKELEAALKASALRNERKLAEEARYWIRQGLGIYRMPAEDTADVVSV
jgi:hypothetical protein